jgi:hypothetical protein
MATSKKPGDETIQGVPNFGKTTDSFVGDASASTSRSGKVVGEMAAEASQGAWRERVFTPRGVMPRDEILKGLESAIRLSLSNAKYARIAFDTVRGNWLPFLRQAVEQAGGDGIDVWLVGLFKGSSRRPLDPLLATLVGGLARMRLARDLAHFEEEALKAIEQVRQALEADTPRRLSFKQMERELEGKIEVDDLLLIAFSSEDELTRRISEIGNTMGQLRDQIKSMPGKQPDGMYSNFVRLKAELRLVDAELRSRPRVAPDQPGTL